jgi:hypothetical protein
LASYIEDGETTVDLDLTIDMVWYLFVRGTRILDADNDISVPKRAEDL